MAKEKILVVDDEEDILELVRYNLAREGYQVTGTLTGEDALRKVHSDIFDLIVLDLMLPGMDGHEVTRRLRAQGDTPIIMLTARRTESDRIAGLEMGADDYVVKPFSAQELVSRVRAVLRRAASGPADAADDAPLSFSDLVIDPAARTVVVRGEEQQLTVKEFDLLLTLARRPRIAFNRDKLLALVWGSADYIDPSTVTVHVRRVRAKIEADPAHPLHITTVWGVGYRFEP